MSPTASRIMDNPPDNLVGIRTLAELVGIRPNLLHYYLRQAEIRTHVLDGRHYIYEGELAEVLQKIARARGRDPLPDGYLSVRDAAERAGVSESTGRTLIRMGKWTAIRRNRRVLVEAAAVDRYVQARRARRG